VPLDSQSVRGHFYFLESLGTGVETMTANSEDLRETILKNMKLAKENRLHNTNNVIKMFSDYNKNALVQAEKLIRNDSATIGTLELCVKNREDLTIEYTMLRHEFRWMFPREILDMAQYRLDQTAKVLEKWTNERKAG
jgi:hypothetical protein